jgi:hypothetical protein
MTESPNRVLPRASCATETTSSTPRTVVLGVVTGGFVTGNGSRGTGGETAERGTSKRVGGEGSGVYVFRGPFVVRACLGLYVPSNILGVDCAVLVFCSGLVGVKSPGGSLISRRQ